MIDLADGMPVREFEHCGVPLVYKRGQYGWHDEFARSRHFYECPTCGTQVCLEIDEHVGPPEASA